MVQLKALGISTRLDGVACYGVSRCTAVGAQLDPAMNTGQGLTKLDFSFTAGQGKRVYAVDFSGAKPRQIKLPPIDGNLLGVACPAVGRCIAVGGRLSGFDHAKPLILEQHAGRWVAAKVVVATPDGTQGVYLTSISCWSTSSCIAVGLADYYPAQRDEEFGPVAVALENGSWSQVSLPTADREAGLTSVSCNADGSCLVLGGLGATTTRLGGPLLFGVQGGTWTSYPTSPPLLQAVSCLGVSDCYAAGSDNLTRNALGTHWAGTSWADDSMQAPQDGYGAISALSCQASSCVAVGAQWFNDYLLPSQPFVERRNGNAWSIVPAWGAVGGASDSLNGVACTSSGSRCLVVGMARKSDLSYSAKQIRATFGWLRTS